jgi:hypothetical protein
MWKAPVRITKGIGRRTKASSFGPVSNVRYLSLGLIGHSQLERRGATTLRFGHLLSPVVVAFLVHPPTYRDVPGPTMTLDDTTPMGSSTALTFIKPKRDGTKVHPAASVNKSPTNPLPDATPLAERINANKPHAFAVSQSPLPVREPMALKHVDQLSSMLLIAHSITEVMVEIQSYSLRIFVLEHPNVRALGVPFVLLSAFVLML